MVYIRRSKDRGASDFGWLTSRHSFSFGGYRDPKHMGISVLRVINDDQVGPGAGFATHFHQNMEIISYVQQGAIEHKDSMGNIKVLPAGEFQLMSAGSGVSHSEYNWSDKDALSFLQIWIEPSEQGIASGYQQKHFGVNNGLTQIVSPDGRDGTLRICQDASLYHLRLDREQSVKHQSEAGRTVYVHVISGTLVVNDYTLEDGDGIGLSDVESIQFNAQDTIEAMVFDLP